MSNWEKNKFKKGPYSLEGGKENKPSSETSILKIFWRYVHFINLGILRMYLAHHLESPNIERRETGKGIKEINYSKKKSMIFRMCPQKEIKYLR